MLLPSGAQAGTPSRLSPDDGRSFAYTSAGRLLIQELSGGPAAEIIRADVAPEGISKLRWSPRGDRIAFVAYYQQWPFLYVASTHGERPLRVTPVTPYVYSAWSPDGSRIALAGEDDPGGFTIHDATDGRLIGSVTLNGFFSAHDISWHPKLDRLALLDRDIGERWVIWIAAPDGREARRVYTDVQAISSICWSPIENGVYFLRPQKEAAELLALDLDDTPSPTREGTAGVLLSSPHRCILPRSRTLPVAVTEGSLTREDPAPLPPPPCSRHRGQLHPKTQ